MAFAPKFFLMFFTSNETDTIIIAQEENPDNKKPYWEHAKQGGQKPTLLHLYG
jgi:hypothetical protein